ncbi:MAG: sterol desaturase family protein [Deltaproteobacteria bacterium]|nr:sterol desaturase family protein [Deltaproteobacteria bacterium]MBW1817119.1 sterol desaturase family protein [Deltaproteobacteria bacterium]MBW2284502.1 sterol desaturase family protein [Deltaproteobacteria bacterium]
MPDFVTVHEGTIRLIFFAGIFVLVALAELIFPRRPLTTSKANRWVANIGIVVINTVLLRLLLPATAVGLAMWAQEKGWGIFNYVAASFWMKVVISVILLDFIIYLQHVMFHAVPALWRLHMMHHADMDYDLTTGTRFHPIEIIISMVIKFSAVILLGAPALSVVVFEILLNGTAMFNHGNLYIHTGIDRFLRLLVVTPDMHRVHHSVFPTEANSNYGFNLPWWDRMLGTYRAQPSRGHKGMTIGLNQFRDPSRLTLPWLLVLPFVGKQGNYAINRRGTREKD